MPTDDPVAHTHSEPRYMLTTHDTRHARLPPQSRAAEIGAVVSSVRDAPGPSPPSTAARPRAHTSAPPGARARNCRGQLATFDGRQEVGWHRRATAGSKGRHIPPLSPLAYISRTPIVSHRQPCARSALLPDAGTPTAACRQPRRRARRFEGGQSRRIGRRCGCRRRRSPNCRSTSRARTDPSDARAFGPVDAPGSRLHACKKGPTQDFGLPKEGQLPLKVCGIDW